MPQRTILLPLDGSRTASRAVPYAAALARLGTAARVVLLTVLPTREEPDIAIEQPTRDEWERVARQRLRASARRLRALGVEQVEIETRWGMHDVDEILEAANRHGAAFIVMGTHGRGGLARALLGSVALGVLQHAGLPCLFVPPGARLREAAIRRALLAIDGSDLSRQAIPLAQELARAGVKIKVLRVVPPSATMVPFAMPGIEGYIPVSVVEDVSAAAEASVQEMVAQFPAGKAEGDVLFGPPAQAINDSVKGSGIDLIIMTTHGRSGITRVLLGSVTDRVMRTAKVPVLVIRPDES